MKNVTGLFIRSIVLILYLSMWQKPSFSQTSQVQHLFATPVRSIGDTLFFGITDFDFLPDGSLIVADKQDYRIKRVSKTGVLLSQTGKRGKAKGEFTSGPFLVTVGKSLIAVADFSSPRVQLFTHSLEAVREFRVNGFVMAMKFDSKDNLWIGTHGGLKNITRLVKYNTHGTIQKEIPISHASDNMFDNLYFFTIIPGDTLVVAYAYQNILDEYSNSYISSWNLAFFPPKPQYERVVSEQGNKLQAPTKEIVYSICSDKNGFVYLLGGDYAFAPFRDVFVLNRNKKISAILQLPVESKKILVDKEGTLWSLESNRTLLTQYTVSQRKTKYHEHR